MTRRSVGSFWMLPIGSPVARAWLCMRRRSTCCGQQVTDAVNDSIHRSVARKYKDSVKFSSTALWASTEGTICCHPNTGLRLITACRALAGRVCRRGRRGARTCTALWKSGSPSVANWVASNVSPEPPDPGAAITVRQTEPSALSSRSNTTGLAPSSLKTRQPRRMDTSPTDVGRFRSNVHPDSHTNDGARRLELSSLLRKPIAGPASVGATSLSAKTQPWNAAVAPALMRIAASSSLLKLTNVHPAVACSDQMFLLSELTNVHPAPVASVRSRTHPRKKNLLLLLGVPNRTQRAAGSVEQNPQKRAKRRPHRAFACSCVSVT